VNDRNAPPEHLVFEPTCFVCGSIASHVELIPPGELPAEWESWPNEHHEAFKASHDTGSWHFVFRSIEGGNGLGDDISAEAAERLAAAFSEPLEYTKVAHAGLSDDAGYCGRCGVPYCSVHWNVDRDGWGRCPSGHSRNLDPLWWPADDE